MSSRSVARNYRVAYQLAGQTVPVAAIRPRSVAYRNDPR